MSDDLPAFTELAAESDPPLDALALALAAEFRDVDASAAIAALDALGDEIAVAAAGAAPTPAAQARVCATVLWARHRYSGDSTNYDDPRNSMLDAVIERRRGLPILLSVLYVETARRAGIPLAGVGLPGHFVVGHFGADPPLLIDPFASGRPLREDVSRNRLAPWSATDIAMRMLNNLVPAYQRRGDLAAAIRAAEMRLELPAASALHDSLELEVKMLRARLN